MSAIRHVCFIVLGICVGAALMPTVSDARVAAPDAAREITQVSEQWAKHWSAKNLDAVVALYAEDAVFLPSNGSRFTGLSSIRDLFAKALAANTSELRVRSKVTGQSGDLAYDSGEYEETSTSGGVTRTGRGNYLVVLRRDSEKHWRIVEHMWTDAPPSGQ